MSAPLPRRRTLVQRSFRHDADNLGRRVVHGAIFTFAGIALRTAITIGSTAILARLLAPADFGHLAMATVVTELAALLANFGFGSILIQRRRIARIQLDTVFWASLSLGVALAAGVFAFSFLAHALFDDPMPGRLLRLLCVSFLLNQLYTVPFALLMRMMLFRQETAIQIGALAIRALAAIALAYAGFGVWSLVGGSIAGIVAQGVLYFAAVRYVPRLRFDRTFLAGTWGVNGAYFGSGLVHYVNANVDLAIVARTLGATPLGYYQNARSLTDEVRARIAGPLQRVLFPAFAALQDAQSRLQSIVLRSGRLMALAIVPMGFGIAAVAEDLVPVLYGSQWLAMIPLLEIIAGVAGVRAASMPSVSVYTATNRVGYALRVDLASTLVFAGALAIGSRYGLAGVAAAVGVTALTSLVGYRIALGLIGLRGADLGRIMGAPIVAASLMVIAVIALREALLPLLPLAAARLGVLVPVGAAVYGALMLVFGREHLRDALAVVARLRAPREART